MTNAQNAIIDGQIIREVKGTKVVHALSDVAYVKGEPALIYTDQNGVFNALSFTVTSTYNGAAMVGLSMGTLAASTVGPFAVKGKAPLISWATANSGILITAMDVSGTVTDSAALTSATIRGFSMGITNGASSIILW